MRKQREMLTTLAATVLTLALAAGCGSGSTAPDTSAGHQADDTTATEGEVPPPADADDVATSTPADPEPQASGLAPAPQAPAASRTSPPPARGTQAADAGVTPSPSIGGTAPADAPARAAESGVAAGESQPAREAAPVARLVELPAGTVLPLRLRTALSSATSAVEDPVTARVVRDVEVGGEVVVPEGSTVSGRVTYAQNSGRVKGRAGLTVRFYTLTVGERTYDIDAEPLRREAQGTKGKDAQKIGIGAGAGAVVGGLLGGRKGAAIGAVAGGAGGTGVVLATKGEEVELPTGTAVDLRLTSPTTLTR